MTPPVNANTALFLDIDGTLLDLARTPDAVIVPDSLKTALCLLSARLDGALAFVSGRSLAMIDQLFAPLRGARRRKACSKPRCWPPNRKTRRRWPHRAH